MDETTETDETNRENFTLGFNRRIKRQLLFEDLSVTVANNFCKKNCMVDTLKTIDDSSANIFTDTLL